MNHHCYADDLQIYLAVDRDESIVTALAKVELCVAEVAAWLTNNNLKLNMEKSEVIIFSSAKKRDSLPADLYMTVSHYTSASATTLATSSSETNLQSAAIELLCSKRGSARLPE